MTVNDRLRELADIVGDLINEVESGSTDFHWLKGRIITLENKLWSDESCGCDDK